MELSATVQVNGDASGETATFSPDFYKRLHAHPHWANFFVLSSETAQRCVPVSLRSVCADPDRGGTMRATYEAEIDLLPAEAYERIALCDSEEGEEMLSLPLPPIEAGESVEFCVTIRLKPKESDGVRFCGGDNPLARMLLGCGSAGEATLRWGKCGYPSLPCVRGDAQTTEMQSVWVSDESSCGLRSSTAAQGKECIMHIGGVPALRAVRPSTSAVQILTGTVARYGLIAFTNYEVENVYGVTVAGASMTRMHLMRSCNSFIDVSGDTGEAVGGEGELLGEPGEQYFAVATTQTVTVYKVDVLQKQLVGVLPRDGERVHLCRGGAVALWGQNALRIYEPSLGAYTCKYNAQVPRGNHGIVLREGARYHAAYTDGSVFKRIALSSEGITLKENKTVTNGCVMGYCGDYLLFGLDGNTIKCCSIDADLSSDFPVLRAAPGADVKQVGDWFLFYESASEGYYYVLDPTHAMRRTIPSSTRICGRVAYDEDKIYVYNFRNGLSLISSRPPLGKVTGAVLAGKGLFTLQDGKLYGWYTEGDCMLKIPTTEYGRSFSASVQTRTYDGAATCADLRVAAG